MITKRRAVSLFALFVLAVFALATPTMGQAPNGQASSAVRLPTQPEWGGSDRVLQTVGYTEFSPSASQSAYLDTPASGRSAIGGAGNFWATLHIPSGALLTLLELDFYDNTGSGNVVLSLYDVSFQGDFGGSFAVLNSSGAPGYGYASMDLTPLGYVVNNNSRRLLLHAITQSGDTNNQIVGAYIGYKLQVSPAPASATFLDVPTGHPLFRFVEALADSGITAGCGGNNFCPDEPLTRGQMAVFLSVALGLHFQN